VSKFTISVETIKNSRDLILNVSRDGDSYVHRIDFRKGVDLFVKAIETGVNGLLTKQTKLENTHGTTH